MRIPLVTDVRRKSVFTISRFYLLNFSLGVWWLGFNYLVAAGFYHLTAFCHIDCLNDRPFYNGDLEFLTYDKNKDLSFNVNNHCHPCEHDQVPQSSCVKPPWQFCSITCVAPCTITKPIPLSLVISNYNAIELKTMGHTISHGTRFSHTTGCHLCSAVSFFDHPNISLD